jgi:hypothetical protein
MGERRGVYGVLVGKPERNFGDPGVNGRIILRWIFRNWDVRVRTESNWLRKRDGWRALVNAVMNLRVP